MNRAKRYLLVTYIFIAIISINGTAHGHPDYNFQQILTLSFIGSLTLAIWVLPVTFIIAKLVDKVKGPT